MLARVVITRGVPCVRLLLGSKQFVKQTLSHPTHPFLSSRHPSLPPSHFLQPRFYSTTQPPKPEGTKEEPTQETKEEENKQQAEETKTEEKTKDNTEQDEANKEKKEGEEEAPIIEPEWKTARAGRYQKQTPIQQEVKVSKGVAYAYWVIGLAGLGIISYTIYDMVTTAYRENSADPNLVFRKALDQVIKAINDNQKLVDRHARGPCVVEESLVQCQVFNAGKVSSITFPLLQPNTAARVGTVYVDLKREGDVYKLMNAYVDFVWGRSLDLVEGGVVKAEEFDFHLFDPEFSMQESMRIMIEQTQAYANQNGPQAQQQPR